MHTTSSLGHAPVAVPKPLTIAGRAAALAKGARSGLAAKFTSLRKLTVN